MPINNPPERQDYKQWVGQTDATIASWGTPVANAGTVYSGSGLSDLSVNPTSYNQQGISVYVITLSATGSPNQFGWTQTGGSGSSASGVAITGAAQTLSDGFTITFAATTGHTISDTWTITVSPRMKMYTDKLGKIWILWSNGTTVQMTAAGGGPISSFDPASPGAIGGTTPGSGAFTTISATGAITSTLATGTAPFTVASTTVVTNLNASKLGGATFAAPGSIGTTTPGAIEATSFRTMHGASNLAHTLITGWTSDTNYAAFYLGRITTPGATNWSIVGTDTGNDLGPLFFNATDFTWRILNSNKMTLDGSTLVLNGIIPKFGGTNSTGAGTALLGATNCPASTLSAVYTWISAVAADGSTVYIPCWK